MKKRLLLLAAILGVLALSGCHYHRRHYYYEYVEVVPVQLNPTPCDVYYYYP